MGTNAAHTGVPAWICGHCSFCIYSFGGILIHIEQEHSRRAIFKDGIMTFLDLGESLPTTNTGGVVEKASPTAAIPADTDMPKQGETKENED